jgi:hypothetical protein
VFDFYVLQTLGFQQQMQQWLPQKQRCMPPLLCWHHSLMAVMVHLPSTKAAAAAASRHCFQQAEVTWCS